MYPYILMILVTIFYSGNILVGKAINDLPPFTIAFFRLIVAVLVLFPIGYQSLKDSYHVFVKHKGPFFVITLTGITFFNTFIYGALQFTTSTKVSVLEAIIPVFTVILSYFYLKERLRSIQWVGVIVSLLGAIWVILNGEIFVLASIDWNIGDAIMLGACVSWAVYSIAIKKYMHFFPLYGTVLAMSIVSALILIPFVLIEWIYLGYYPTFDIGIIIGLGYIGIFPSFFAIIFYNRAVDMIGATRASIFLNFMPVFTMAGAYVWLGEEITMMHIIGVVAVILGVILTTRAGKRQEERIDQSV